jgi:beta-N-acetylhexosaminidase
MLAVGIGLDFAPVSDVLPVDGDSAIGDRSYGSDPHRDATLVAAAVDGYQHAGVAATLKHFPGLGRVPQDTHDSLPSLDVSCSSWNTHEAVPLRAGIAAGVSLVMTGHVQVPAIGEEGSPASLSESAVTDLLKGDGRDGCTGLQFGGVTVSDSLQMVPVADVYSSAQAAVLALNAGEDLLLMPVRPDAAAAGIVAAVNNGSLSPERLNDAVARVLALRIAAARIVRPPLSVIDSPAHQRLAAEAREAAGQ